MRLHGALGGIRLSDGTEATIRFDVTAKLEILDPGRPVTHAAEAPASHRGLDLGYDDQRGSGSSSSTLRSPGAAGAGLAARLRVVERQLAADRGERRRARSAAAGVPARASRATPPWSISVPKIDSVPSLLSMTSSRRDWIGQSISEEVSMPQKPPPSGARERRDLVLVRVAGDVGDDARVGEQQRLQVGAEVQRLRVARIAVAAGVDVMAVEVVARARRRDLVGEVGGQRADRVVAEEDHELVARRRRPGARASIHWNCGSSMLPSAAGPGMPASATVSIAIRRTPGLGENE